MSATHRTLKVLIVEDSGPIRQRLVRMLQEVTGIEIVAEAEDEANALTLYDKHEPDAAVVDIRIRNGSGIAVLDYIKRHNPDCAVVMLTNCVQLEFRQRCLEAGANHFLEKSREFSRVTSVFRQLIRQQSDEQE